MNFYPRYTLILSLLSLVASGFSSLAQSRDLIYVSLGSPCEVINTTKPAGGGAFSVGVSGGVEPRAYRAWSDNTHSLTNQGGGDCPNPDSSRVPLAVAATITARSRGGFHSKGNLTAFAVGAEAPAFTESHLNFWNENITNTTIIPLNGQSVNHFRLRARIFTPVVVPGALKVHVTASVLGYYYASPAAQSLGHTVIVTSDNDGANFNDPVAALKSIQDADKDNPYMLDIGPGRYMLSEMMLMKEYVSIRGAGIGKTILVGRKGLTDITSGVIRGAKHASLMNLSILNAGVVGTGEFRAGIINRFDETPLIENVDIELKDKGGSGSQHCFGIINRGKLSGLRPRQVFIRRTSISVDCDVNAYGIFNDAEANPVIEHVKVKVKGSGNSSDAIHNTDNSDVTIRHSTVEGGRFGIRAISGAKTHIAYTSVTGGVESDNDVEGKVEEFFCGFVVDDTHSQLDCPES